MIVHHRPLTKLASLSELLTSSMRELTSKQVVKKLWAYIEPEPGPDQCNQKQLAARIGVSQPFLNDILHAKREPSGKVLKFLGLERVVKYRFRRTQG